MLGLFDEPIPVSDDDAVAVEDPAAWRVAAQVGRMFSTVTQDDPQRLRRTARLRTAMFRKIVSSTLPQHQEQDPVDAML